MAGQSAETQFAVVALDFVQTGNEVEIDQSGRTCKAHFHERNEALAAGNQARFVAQLLQEL